MMAYYSASKSEGFSGLSILGLIQMAAGILILIAFLPRKSGAQPLFRNAQSARVKGDGTTSVSLFVVIAATLGGCYLGDFLCRRWSPRAALPSDSSFLHNQLIFFAALIAGIVFHELGHIGAGRMVGMKLLSFRVGPLQAAFEEGKWRLVPPRSWRCVFASGVSMIPENPLNYDRRQAIVGAAGGTLANLLVGGGAFLGVLTAKGSPYESCWDFLAQLATLNLAFFAGNLIPVQEASAYSDGARIYQILSGSVLEDYRRILAMSQATTVTPLRPRDFDIDLIEKITLTNAPSFDQVFLLLVASDYYFDSGQLESARQKTRAAEALRDEQASYWAENCGSIVLRAACLLEDRAMAEKWWQRSSNAKSWNPGKKNHFPACAYLTITGRLPEAEEAWKAEFEHTNRLPETGERAFDFYYLERLREMLDEAARRAEDLSPMVLGEQLEPALMNDSIILTVGSE